MSGFVKLACAVTAMFFPFAAGLLTVVAVNDEVRLVVIGGGVLLGMAGLFGFAASDRRGG